MSEHVYKITEIVGTSHDSHDAAIAVALERAKKTLRHIRWFEVSEHRGYVEDDGNVVHQARLKVGFTLDE